MNLCNITASSVMFFFTNRTGSTMNVKMEVTDTERAILPLHKGLRQRLDDRVRSRWKESNRE